MNDADYDDALHLLRSDVEQPSDDGEATRMSVLAAVHANRRGKRRNLTFIAIAACLATSIAFAHYLSTPARDPRSPQPGEVRGVPHQVAKPHSVRSVPAPENTQNSAHVAPLPVGKLSTVRGAKGRRMRPSTAPKASIDTPETGSIAPESSRNAGDGTLAVEPAAKAPDNQVSEAKQQALYWTAHRLQFRGAPIATLAAWDAYLATNPQGPLVAEAQYNRAIILLRLARYADARSALLPFARGDLGGFRQADARRLLTNMPVEPQP